MYLVSQAKTCYWSKIIGLSDRLLRCKWMLHAALRCTSTSQSWLECGQDPVATSMWIHPCKAILLHKTQRSKMTQVKKWFWLLTRMMYMNLTPTCGKTWMSTWPDIRPEPGTQLAMVCLLQALSSGYLPKRKSNSMTKTWVIIECAHSKAVCWY